MDQFLQWFDRGGVAIVLVAFGMVTFWAKIWPYITKRQDRIDAEEKVRKDAHDADEKDRHREYMRVIGELGKHIGDFAKALNTVNVTTNALGQLIANMTNKIDDHHAEIMAELGAKR